MSNVSIFEKKWIELVFEGKNKEYGAYQLRQESPKTTLKALFFAVFSISFASGIIMMLSSFRSKPIPDPIEPIIDSAIVVTIEPKIEEPEKPKKVEPKRTVSDPIPEPDFFKPVVVETPLADQNVFKNDDLEDRNPTDDKSNGDGNGTETTPVSSDGGENGNEDSTPKEPNKVIIAAVLDAQPEFPGGIRKFYDYVGNNFQKQEIEDVESLTVNVSFVIEKDGSMSDIKVLRNPGYGLDKEAIRVLKSLKTKWKPGVLNGQNVRTQYTLPITVKLN
jgi:periplasmic protein TonB